MKLFSLVLTLAIASTAHATTIAIIDSGTDLTHKELKGKEWSNAKDIDDAVDNDDNGYIDDVHGWNFADSNNKLIDKQYLGTFSPDVYKFFEVQTRMLKGEGTAEDTAWMNAARGNSKLIAELGTFGNFVHGTHVAGITAKNADAAKIMVLKIIPTKSPLGGGGKATAESNYAYGQIMGAKGREGIVKAGLKLLASQQAKSLAPIGTYVGKQKARIANCSFGTSTAAAKTILGPILKIGLGHEPTADELEMYAEFFVAEIVKASSALVTPAPNTLFVIAAGNDGMDNDKFPTSPSNIKVQNTIAVAATLGYKKIASFSNYGKTMVEVAAPGVGIESTIPGNLYLTVSGTSQASPFVANIAGLAIDANPSLSNSDLKKILMETVDQKDFLKGMVISGGIVNTSRAIMAATMSKSMQLSDAINSARLQVNDVNSGFMFESMSHDDYEGYVMPMPSLFQ
jgi:subtilisin family serine protease